MRLTALERTRDLPTPRLADPLFKTWVGAMVLLPVRGRTGSRTLVRQAPHAYHHADPSMTATTAAWEGSARAPSPLERPERMPEDEADMASTPPLRVMLVDDHEVVRDGIKALLAPNDDIVVCAEAATVRQAVAEADRDLPDVIVMDVRLQDSSGIEATRDIRAARPQTQVLMLTSFADDQALFASILAGAAGYVLKQIRGDDLVQAIRTVGAGQSLLDPAVTKGVLDRLRKGKHLLKDERLARLSPQEERILELVSTGRTNKQIGEELHLAEKTVKNYVSSILAKLEVTRRAEAASYLTRHTTTPGT
jgi:DNA-binding NarL/FixJ family response regulator